MLSSLVVKVLHERVNLAHWAIHGHRLLMESQKYPTLGVVGALARFTVTMSGTGDCIAYGAPSVNTYKGCTFTME